MAMNEDEREDFRGFCRQATDSQLREIYRREKAAHGADRQTCEDLARAEIERRGLALE